MEHSFTPEIKRILQEELANAADSADAVYEASELLQYLNVKTKSASRGSKSRGSFANHYAVYVLVEDYIAGDFHQSGMYEHYEGAKYSDLLRRQRELPFGRKLQNHALNHRMNQEFRKYFSTCEYIPILRNTESNRYWINENLLKVSAAGKEHNIAVAVIRMIDAYVEAKKEAFLGFLGACQKMQALQKTEPEAVREFIADQLKPSVDARVFEIISYAILKEYYAAQAIFWGWKEDELYKESLILYKTGRTNANDGGIDFVMRPLGRFFQVTETTDMKKYLLDIDKVQRYPITFVVKSTESTEKILGNIRQHAKQAYSVASIVQRYVDCIEEIVNIPILLERFGEIAEDGRLTAVMDEVVLWSKVEFHYEEN